jgi:hypothetical protein
MKGKLVTFNPHHTKIGRDKQNKLTYEQFVSNALDLVGYHIRTRECEVADDWRDEARFYPWKKWWENGSTACEAAHRVMEIMGIEKECADHFFEGEFDWLREKAQEELKKEEARAKRRHTVATRRRRKARNDKGVSCQ